MLDKLEKTLELIAGLKAAAPFEVELPPPLRARLRAQRVAFDLNARHMVSKISCAGDEGGILCHIEPDEGQGVLIISMTHLKAPRSLPFADAVLDYQQHRNRKLRKQAGG